MATRMGSRKRAGARTGSRRAERGAAAKGARASESRSATTARSRRATPGRRRPASKPLAPSKDFVLRTVDREWRLEPYPEFQRDAMYWAYVARRRSRWQPAAGEPSGRDAHDGAPMPPHRLLGADARKALEHIAAAGLVEVSVPYSGVESEGWEARVLPWEYLLSRATKPYRSRPISVVRHLAVRGAPKRRPGAVPMSSALIVESVPSGLHRWNDVELETELVRASLALGIADAPALASPTADELRERIAAVKPAIVHVAGEDTHTARELLDLEPAGKPRDARRLDGLAMRSATSQSPDFVPAQQLAALLAGGSRAPALVLFDLFNSAGRIAPLTVAEGAGAAIGFQDTIEEELAGVFYTSFYQALRRHRGELLPAFRDTLAELRSVPTSMRGAGIVLWSGTSLVEREAARPRAAAPRARRGRTARAADAPVIAPARPRAEAGATRSKLLVKVKPVEDFNYSLVHNGRSLFEHFTLARLGDAPIHDVHVEVVMHVGPDSFPYRRTLSVELSTMEIGPSVAIPLTAALVRTAAERMHTTLFVQVSQGPLGSAEIVYRDTSRVTLTPVDEWIDNDSDWSWLPSFVLPRDPAVTAIIDAARAPLRRISGRPDASFAGYQLVNDDATSTKARYRMVDAQVSAIWWVLSRQWKLGYINPPPAYSENGQRLRTPSDVRRESQGTCIDLMLLMAACMEYVDLWPVLFLLDNHAFPGYWRDERLHEQWVTGELFAGGRGRGMTDWVAPSGGDRFEDRYAITGRDGFLEARKLKLLEVVVPIEATRIADRFTFARAVGEGMAHFPDDGDEDQTDRDAFHSMTDLTLARRHRITPLPILSEGAEGVARGGV